MTFPVWGVFLSQSLSPFCRLWVFKFALADGGIVQSYAISRLLLSDLTDEMPKIIAQWKS